MISQFFQIQKRIRVHRKGRSITYTEMIAVLTHSVHLAFEFLAVKELSMHARIRL